MNSTIQLAFLHINAYTAALLIALAAFIVLIAYRRTAAAGAAGLCFVAILSLIIKPELPYVLALSVLAFVLLSLASWRMPKVRGLEVEVERHHALLLHYLPVLLLALLMELVTAFIYRPLGIRATSAFSLLFVGALVLLILLLSYSARTS